MVENLFFHEFATNTGESLQSSCLVECVFVGLGDRVYYPSQYVSHCLLQWSRYDVTSEDNIGNVLSPHEICLIEEVKMWKKEGNSLLLRYTILGRLFIIRGTTRVKENTYNIIFYYE